MGVIRRSWGRLGDGPGEFRAVNWVGTCGGDTLYVWDERAKRLSVLHADAGYVRQFSASTSTGAFSAACDRGGNVALFAGIAPRRGSGPSTTPMKTADGREYQVGVVGATIVVHDRTGALIQELRDVTYGEMLMGQLVAGGGMGAMPRPLGHITSFALIDGQLVVARSDTGMVSWHRRDGSAQGIVRLPVVRGAPTEAQLESSAARSVEAAPARLRADLVTFATQVPRPATHRPFSQMLAGGDDQLWFVTSVPGDAVTRLRAMNRTGAITATLDINAALEVFEVGKDYVLGRTENANGEQRVVLYRYAR